ncbi:MAG: O-antigen ligase family protein [Candidatus Kapabacteria bacterium]|jgi:hypothetical protein|nr:O-antigen ligase family protein [Candidatus Kapabacteria bacterium]
MTSISITTKPCAQYFAIHRDSIVLSTIVATAIPLALLFTGWISGIMLVALPLLALVFMLFVRYPRIWLYTGAVLNYFWISSGKGDEAITLKEYALVAFIMGGLWIWMFSMVFIQKRSFIRHFGDKVLVFTVFLMSVNLLLVLVNDQSSALTWLREYLLFYTMLYYLPWREHFTKREHIFTFLSLTAGVFIFIGATNLWQYVKAASNVLYAYQVWTSRKMLNTHIFLCATVLCSMGALYASTRKARLGMLCLTAFYAIVVLVSFSRGFWISGMVGIIATLWLIDKRKVATVALYSLLGGIFVLFAIQILFPERAALIIKVIQSRFASSAAGTQDLSLLARIYETRVVVDVLLQYILGGVGLGAAFTIFDPLERYYTRVTFIHNGYLYIWVKLGLPFFLAFYGAWAYMMRRAYTLARQKKNAPLQRILAAGAFGSLVAFTLLNVTSAIPEARDGFYCLSVLFAAIGFAEYLPTEISFDE